MKPTLETKIIALLMVVVLAILLIGGCRPTADTQMKVSPPVASSSRVTVTRIGVFEDSMAYGDRRGIYIITDTKTGKEYIGVSGIGISELGSHSNGKVIVGDER